MKLLIIDNYDSFTYNLVHYAEQFVDELSVFRNDKIDLDSVAEYDAIIISPGPGIPETAGITLNLIKKYGSTIPMLGICLGHEAIAMAYGAQLINLPDVLHGVAIETMVVDESEPIFESIPKTFKSGRYHSWVISEKDLPESLKIIARDADGNIAALRHEKYNLCGVQFHPESIMTEYGLKMIENWVKSVKSFSFA
ncbi:MAG: aminodeoxychorismate/anthranilate synthase component II [Bacteroidetes bacterium]|nr:aminodeoxychorismate/anthranilate synthase component II [Bacteroidota bacterium]